MLKLNSDNTTGKILRSGKCYIQVELSGGSADLKLKLPKSNNYMTFEGSTLSDGIFSYDLPRSDVLLTVTDGNPHVWVMSEYQTESFNGFNKWDDTLIWDDSQNWSDYVN